jgi:hypothetical protein
VSLVDLGPSFGGLTVHDVDVIDGSLLNAPLHLCNELAGESGRILPAERQRT